ncbi:MAG TPA: amidohydrolase family protein [Candidatus Atribacteria bacterium]|nr:amidohydrolase family protein [Candidatus Atribacteria bacterium]
MGYVLKNLNLIDGTGGPVVNNAVVVVEGTKIKAVGKEGEVEYPADYEVLDLGGKTVLPGMVEAHVHIGMNGEPAMETIMLKETLPMTTIKASVYAQKDLMAGFTTIRTMGDKGFLDVALKRAIDAGIIDGPRMRVSGQILSITGGHGDIALPPEVTFTGWSAIVDSPDEARKAARYQLKMGADIVKMCATGGVMSEGDEPGSPQLNEDEMRAAIYEAHKVGKKAAAHAQGTKGIKDAVKAGIDSIEHGIFLDDEVVEMMREKGVYLVATLSAPYNIKKYGVEAGIPDYAVRKTEQVIDAHGASFMKAYRAGVKIAVGTDAGTPFNRHGENAQELEMMVQAGVKPMDAILAATKWGADLLGMSNIIGTIEAGKEADIIAVEGNPLENISLLKDVKFVMKAGKIYKN